MKKYTTILFDFDGTLVDLDGFIEKYTQDFVSENNIQVDQPLGDFYREINSGSTNHDLKLIEKFKQGLKEKMPEQIQLMEGVLQMLPLLKQEGYHLGIVSTGYLERLNKILDTKGIRSYFEVLIGKEDVINRKPNPEPINKAIEKLHDQTENVLYIGNNKEDIEMGKAAGVDTVFFVENENYAVWIKDWLEENNPKLTIRNYKELLEILRTQGDALES